MNISIPQIWRVGTIICMSIVYTMRSLVCETNNKCGFCHGNNHAGDKWHNYYFHVRSFLYVHLSFVVFMFNVKAWPESHCAIEDSLHLPPGEYWEPELFDIFCTAEKRIRYADKLCNNYITLNNLSKVYCNLVELINDSRFLYTIMIASVTIIICFGLQHILINRFSIKDFCKNAFFCLFLKFFFPK